ncbi:SGNH/GDSL hydrolase family protein [Dactylosporangium sp. CA-092794]|uniref:SGNH/GDSL hydrolase family protein n=1 Tax=Dactylosporangium sp. CA-092794 TaxID=3239929 RepID=UPI003D8A1FAD
MLVRIMAVVLALTTAGTSMSATAATRPRTLVALGDSSAAGPLIPEQIDPVCLRSDHDWPHLLADRLGAALTDVTCSGARIPDLTGRQLGTVPPQFDALRRDTDLVTLAISANDIQLGAAFVTCASPDPATTGPTCREQWGDTFATRIRDTAPQLAAALTEIHRRAPRARVLVVGYLTYWRPGGCYPADPFRPADADYIQTAFDQLMAMMARVARLNGASYVDIRGPSARHDLCEPPPRRWLEGATPASPAYPYHPNATGMAEAALIIAHHAR